MNAALFVAIFVSMLVAIFLPMAGAFALSGEQGKAARDAALARRAAEHRMNARLLRLNI
jgi:hypothetical protein